MVFVRVRRGGIIRGRNKEWEENVGRERGYGIDQESEGPYSGGILVKSINLLGRHVGVGFKVWLDIDIADVGTGVEKLGKEAHPGKELHFTDLPGLRRQSSNGFKDLLKEGDYAASPFNRWSFEPGIALPDGTDADDDSTAQSNTGYRTEDLELRVSKPPDILGQV